MEKLCGREKEMSLRKKRNWKKARRVSIKRNKLGTKSCPTVRGIWSSVKLFILIIRV